MLQRFAFRVPQRNIRRKLPGSVWSVIVGVLTATLPQITLAQDDAAVQAIKQIEAAGGRVMKISAADDSREVSFNLASQTISDQHLKGINTIKDVLWVNLAGTDISDEGLKHIAGMPITKLHLEHTKIGNAGLKHLQSLKKLEYLNVYDTQVSDAGLMHLKGMKHLKKLYVWESKVTPTGIEQLAQSLPDLKIVGELKLKPVAPIDDNPKDKTKPKDKDKTKPNANTKASQDQPKPTPEAGGKLPGDADNAKKKDSSDQKK